VNLDDTIVAIATPAGRGGIGVVRLAGPLNFKIGVGLVVEANPSCRCLQRHWSARMAPSLVAHSHCHFDGPVTIILAALFDRGFFLITISTSRSSAFKKCIIRSTENPSNR
jgi:hypothetical protein